MWRNTLKIVLLLALAFFSFLMIRITVAYSGMESNVKFLMTKQRVYPISWWRLSFYTHVFTSCFVLIAGFTQFSPWILRHYPRVHRGMGWAYFLIVTMVSGPAAWVMALYANGGLPARTSFVLLATGWIGFTGLAGYYALGKRFALHGAYMFRSYALTLSAITLRLYTFILQLTTLASPRDIYITTAWLSWVPNLLLAEWLIRRGLAEKLMASSPAALRNT
jgi:hypothetical protein